MSEPTKIAIKRTVEFSDQDLCDILTTAFEGGINAWCPRYEHLIPGDPERIAAFRNSEGLYLKYMAPVFGGELHIYDDGHKLFSFTRDHLVEGLQRLLNDPDYAWVLDDDIMCNIDANVASAIIEYGIFGSVVYC